jgi:sialic acid synthase SpsE
MKSYIIAEMAWGYTGSYDTAIELLNYVEKADANAIGIHLTDMETYMTKDYACLAGQTLSARDVEEEVSVYKYLDDINMKNEEWLKFDKEAEQLGVDIVAMCNDYQSFLFSREMNVKRYVIAASLFHEWDLLSEIVKYNNDLIIRIGGASLQEIDDIIEFILSVDGNAKINLLAGIQLYPTPLDQLHFQSIQVLAERYRDKNVTLGVADHIDGDHPYAKFLPAIALAYGIETVEKHITTKRSVKLEDFEAALGGEDFIEFVEYIRIAEIALGDGSLNYLIDPQNEKYRLVLRKRVVAKEDIKQGDIITDNILTFMRCDEGVELEYLDNIKGHKAVRNITKNSGINSEDVL